MGSVKKTWTRLISAVICLAMLLSCVTIGYAAEESPYVDVKTTARCYKSILFATEKGLMSDIGGGKFDPKGTLTRGMVVSVLYRMSYSPRVEYTKRFEDVAKGKWYTDAILWAESRGIVSGISATKFNPTGNITREQIATILYSFAYYRYVIMADGADFADNHYAKIGRY